jgi:hypothetical protein
MVDGVAHRGERAGGVAEDDPLLVAERGAQGLEIGEVEFRSDGGGVEAGMEPVVPRWSSRMAVLWRATMSATGCM